MLFNSYEFIFAFLPITFAVFFFLARFNRPVAAAWLAAASLFFYGWWDARYVGLLGCSIIGNFLAGSAIARTRSDLDPRKGRTWLILAITTNLALLCYYKYANFFASSIAALGGFQWQLNHVILPLGISFFTFTQIAFLVDAYQGKAREYDVIHYTLFVTYFPHLIAGPVLHHKEMMPQFTNRATYAIKADNVAIGLTIFLIGLFKKTVLADGVAPYAGPVFVSAARGDSLGFFDAWGGALAYTLQLYFDFSGYSDMAIGLSRMFGVRLPLNFNSPYKAVNIIDFWRRWHMTLSRFLRDYLYVPLGGNRLGTGRRHLNLMITMVLGGLWHGAGWPFVIWGILHGAYLMANHAWISIQRQFGWDRRRPSLVGSVAAQTITLVCVVVGWVFFRAESLDAAVRILSAMTGLHGVSLPSAILAGLGSVGSVLQQVGVGSVLGGGTQFVAMFGWIAVLSAIVLFAPNSQQIMERYASALDHVPAPSDECPKYRWHPTVPWAMFMALIGAGGVLSLSRVSEFLYFQF